MIYDYLIITFLLIFLIASFFAQFKDAKIRNYDYLGLLPSFRFFAPRPVTRDIRVFATGFDTNGNSSNWQELFAGERSWHSFFWNPQHRLRKTVIDLYADIDEYREAENIWHLSFPYLVILNAATFLFASDPKFQNVQFMITCYAGSEEETHDVIFKSNVHSIRRAD